jgi:methylthioribose-1-phosphate isomerase
MVPLPSGAVATRDLLPPTVRWDDGVVVLVDQRQLPDALVFRRVADVQELCGAIGDLTVRGAPALAVAGAYGVALAHHRGEDVHTAARCLLATRPTAVNLARGVQRALAAADPLAEAHRVADEDVATNRLIGANGAALLPERVRVLTHCHAGGLACAGYGTALGIIRWHHEHGGAPSAWVRETRPLLQGSRITAWELARLGIPATVLVDSAAAALMAAGQVDCCIVGADRIAANGDVANKIGTYDLAIVAAHHGVPVYVAAPLATIDTECASGAVIPIEERSGEELRQLHGRVTAPRDAEVWNPAFDVTPAELVSAIVTERGVLRPPFAPAIAELASP